MPTHVYMFLKVVSGVSYFKRAEHTAAVYCWTGHPSDDQGMEYVSCFLQGKREIIPFSLKYPLKLNLVIF